ncbi:MAG: chromate transporter [Clostridia bacterium]|nr:chromate transporter [Clostridia bacterium]MBQ6708468.1 chromate transporter [Clostridia bacterium]
MKYLILFYEFFRTGLFAVGGGMATLPFLSEMSVNHPDWFDSKMLADMIAVSESTPGPIGVNMATYAGYNAGGVLGGVISTFALVLPSFLTIIILSKFLAKFSENKYVKAVFYGLRPAVAGLIAAAGFSVLKTTLYVGGDSFLSSLNWIAIALFAVFLTMMQIKKLNKIHPIVYIVSGAVIGIILKLN